MDLARTRDRQHLLIFARRWLYEHRLLIMHERSIRSTIVKARQQSEVALAKGIHAAIDDERLAGWAGKDMFCEIPERPTKSIFYGGGLKNHREIDGVSTGSYCTKIKCTPYRPGGQLDRYDYDPRGRTG
jgi:hypothetical protein